MIYLFGVIVLLVLIILSLLGIVAKYQEQSNILRNRIEELLRERCQPTVERTQPWHRH